MNKYNIYTIEGTIIQIQADTAVETATSVTFAITVDGTVASFNLSQIIGWSDQDNVITP